MPERHKGEKKKDYVQRCISDPQMKEEFPDVKQRVAVCISKAIEDLPKDEQTTVKARLITQFEHYRE